MVTDNDANEILLLGFLAASIDDETQLYRAESVMLTEKTIVVKSMVSGQTYHVKVSTAKDNG